MTDATRTPQSPGCDWATGAADCIAYHDDEWGMPTVDDRRLFEKLCLEGFQAGLSWLTILRRRDAFRRAFNDFVAGCPAGVRCERARGRVGALA